MSYTEKLLSTNEKIVASTHKHLFRIFSELFKELVVVFVLVAVFITLKYQEVDYWFVNIGIFVILFLAFASIAIDVIRWKCEAYVVTNRRVIHTKGILSKHVIDSSLNKINDVTLEQSFLGRIFGYGTIRILTASDETINSLADIAKPLEFKHAMMNAKAEMEPIGTLNTPSKIATQALEELAELRARKLVSEAEFEEKPMVASL